MRFGSLMGSVYNIKQWVSNVSKRYQDKIKFPVFLLQDLVLINNVQKKLKKLVVRFAICKQRNAKSWTYVSPEHPVHFHLQKIKKFIYQIILYFNLEKGFCATVHTPCTWGIVYSLQLHWKLTYVLLKKSYYYYYY